MAMTLPWSRNHLTLRDSIERLHPLRLKCHCLPRPPLLPLLCQQCLRHLHQLKRRLRTNRFRLGKQQTCPPTFGP